jgi:hypothetical protein
VLKTAELGVTPGLCDSILMMRSRTKAIPLDVKVEWSGMVPVIATAMPTQVEFRRDDIKLVQDAAKAFRTRARRVRETSLEGTVTDLHEEVDLKRGIRGLVTIKSLSGQAATVFLSPFDYASACDAHRDQKVVTVVGKLVTDKSGSRFESYIRFVVGGRV